MYRLCFAFMLLADLAGAATIANMTVTCDGVTTSASSCQENNVPAAFVELSSSFPYSVAVEAIVDTGHSASASVSLQADVPITIISGPSIGYFVPCISAESDSVLGSASVSAMLGPDGAASSGNGLIGDCTSISKDEFVPYRLGVTEILPLSMTVSAGALPSGPGGQAGAVALFDTLAVFNSAGNPIFPAYTLTESPEPTSSFLVFCGVLFLFVARHGFARSHARRDSAALSRHRTLAGYGRRLVADARRWKTELSVNVCHRRYLKRADEGNRIRLSRLAPKRTDILSESPQNTPQRDLECTGCVSRL